jgi:calcineurin-like phosphoesterase family protein
MNTPLTRRSALLTLGAAASHTLLWPSWSLAQERTVPNFSFLVVSDTHLGRGDNESAARQWERTAAELNTTPGDFVLHLGDIVDRGLEPQYAIYRNIRQTIRKPVHEIPGNHDPAELFQRHIRREVDTSFDHQGIRFVLMNNSHTDSHNGFLTADQITWLTQQCTQAADRDLFLILCMHVPAHQNRHPDRGWYIHPEHGQTALYALLRQHRDRVLSLFHGHFHNGIRGWDDHAPLQEISFPSALYNQDRRLAAQNAPGFYLSELRPGFVRVTLQQTGMTLSYHPVGVANAMEERRCPLPQLRS